jgi:outer membrane protein, heavy metal efflux system
MNTQSLAIKPIVICLSFCLMLIFAFSAKAEESLSLAESIQLATQDQPLLQSLDAAAASSRQAAIAESQLSDPKLKFGVINLPISNRNALRFDREDMTMVNVGIAQDVIPLMKREAISNLILAEADQFHTEQIATARTIERDVALAWVDAFEAQRKSDLYQSMIDNMTADRKVQVSSVSSGSAKTSDVLRMDTQISTTNEKLILAKRDERKARAVLARWIGKAASRTLSSELPVMTNRVSHDLAQLEIEKHPLLQNALQSERVAQYDVESAQANNARNWGWEIGYGKRFNDRSDMLSFQVSVDLQLDRANRQDKRTAEKLVLIEKARQQTEDRRRELSSELESAMADAEAAEARENVYLTKLIPNAEAKLSIAQAAYQSGKNPLSDVWQARRDIIDIELDHWAILTNRQRAAIKMGYLLNDNRLFKIK